MNIGHKSPLVSGGVTKNRKTVKRQMSLKGIKGKKTRFSIEMVDVCLISTFLFLTAMCVDFDMQ